MRFRGVVYRAHDPRWSWAPLSGEGARLYGGRFNRRGVPALYTSLAMLTAIWESQPVGRPLQPLLLCAYAAADAIAITNLVARARHGNEMVRGEPARWARFDPRPCLMPPDWSKTGHKSIFQHQQREAAQ